MEKCSIFIKNTVFLSDDSEKLFFEKKKIKNGCFFDMLLCLIENKYQDFCQIFLYAEGRMIGMKNTKRWLAILLALVITVFSVPASCLVFGTDVEVIELTTLDAFTSGTEKYTATSGVILSTINAAGVIGDGKALEVKGDSLGSWSKFSVNIPLSCSVGNAKGLLAYVKWVNNSNFFVSVGGTSDGNNVTGTLKKWNYGIPLFNAASDSWTGSAESNNEGAIFVGGNFKGYVYIPFGKLFGKEAPVTLTDLNIESFRTESVGTFTIGGVWLVNNDIIPDDFSDDLTTKVLLDNTVNTDLSKNSDGNINLKTLEDFTVNTSFNIAVDGNTVNGASVTVIDNIGSIGNGKSLAVDVNNDGSWAIAYLNIPLSVDIGTSKGLLVYAKWGSNSNMYLRLTGTGSSGDSLSATPISGWCNYPIYRVSNDRWSGTDYAGTNTSYNVGNSFEGYAYIPFERLTNTLSTLSALEIGAFRASGCSVFTIGGVWMVENNVIPNYYEDSAFITNNVLIDGAVNDDLKKKTTVADITDRIVLSTLTDLTTDEIYSVSVTNDNGETQQEGVSVVTTENIGAVGGGKALSFNASGANSWRYINMDILLNNKTGLASGLLVYVQWAENVNFSMLLTGKKSDGTEVTATFRQWNENIPIFDAVCNKWAASEQSGNAGKARFTNAYFEGYIYIPFSKLDNTGIATLTNLRISSYKEKEASHIITLGGIYLVENSVIPASFSNGTEIVNAVEVDGGDTTTLNNPVLGDFNKDQSVDSTDISELRRYLLGFDSITDYTDIRKDGTVNILDFVRLKNILVNRVK